MTDILDPLRLIGPGGKVVLSIHYTPPAVGDALKVGSVTISSEDAAIIVKCFLFSIINSLAVNQVIQVGFNAQILLEGDTGTGSFYSLKVSQDVHVGPNASIVLEGATGAASFSSLAANSANLPTINSEVMTFEAKPASDNISVKSSPAGARTNRIGTGYFALNQEYLNANGDEVEGVNISCDSSGGSLYLCNSAGALAISLSGTTGNVTANDISASNVSVSGDITLKNADCAEEFDIEDGRDTLTAGTVVSFSDSGALREAEEAYDVRVAGVVSGAGDYAPAIVLDRRSTGRPRARLALVGKAYCKVDATYHSINVGDLLTTSPTPGHAMRASDAHRAFGAVIGKALAPLQGGRNMIPVLVSLR